MKSMVIYDSEYGNTRQLAEAIAEELEVVGAVEVRRAGDGPLSLPSDVALLVVGGPTQVHRVSPRLRAYLETLASGSLAGILAATFDTRSHGLLFLTGAASRGIAKLLKHKGARTVVGPESFIVEGSRGPLADGEEERARAWAREILVQVNTNAAHTRVGP